jgi:hypothetical protein
VSAKRANQCSFPQRGQILQYRLDGWPPLQTNAAKLPVLCSPCSLILPQGSDVRSIRPDGQVISSRHACWGSSGWIDFPVLFSLYVNDMPSPSHHLDLAPCANDRAIIATFRNPTLLVSYLESYLNDLQRWLSEWRITINVSKSTKIIFARAGRRFIQPRTVTLFGDPIRCVDTTRYQVAILDTRLTWSPHID